MSVKKILSLSRCETQKTAKAPAKVKKTRSLVSSSGTSGFAHGGEVSSASREPRKDSEGSSPFTGEITIEPEGARSLEEVDSGKLKAEIRRWAKRVASYARQVSGRFRRSMTVSSRSSSSFGNGR